MITPLLSSNIIKKLANKWIEEWKCAALTYEDIAKFLWEWLPVQYQYSGNISETTKTASDLLQEFMFYENEDFLNERHHSPSMCENIIREGNFFYMCEPCQAYKGRILCVYCFNFSVHQNHKYKIGIAESITFCNCGEREAWKNEWCCTKHVKEDKNVLLPQEVQDRSRIVFQAFLLLVQDFATLREPLNRRYVTVSPDRSCVVLYDDPQISNLEKVELLQHIMNSPNDQSDEKITQMIRILNKEGRVIFGCLSEIFSQALIRKIENFGTELGVLFASRNEILAQNFIYKMTINIRNVLQCGNIFKNIFSEVLTKPLLSRVEMLNSVFANPAETKTNAKISMLLISSSLKDYTTKKILAEYIIENYGQLKLNWNRNDFPLNVPLPMKNLTVHLFTVPSLSHHLISCGGIGNVLSAFQDNFKFNYTGFRHPDIDGEFNFALLDRSLNMLRDLKYLLSAVPTVWTEELRRSFQKDVEIFLNLLSNLQESDAEVRKTGQHVQYERSWKEALAVQQKIGDCAGLILKWCAADEDTLFKTYQKTMIQLRQKYVLDFKVVEVLNYSAACLLYNSETQPTSIYLPLSRFLAGLHVCLRYTNEMPFRGLTSNFISIIDPVLKVRAMVAQVNAGLWRRNGNSITNRILYYQHLRFRTEMLDRDIQLLQIGACRIESNQFIIVLLEKFNLINWTNPNFEETLCMMEQFLELIIYLISERHTPEVSYDGIAEHVKYEIIHALCIKPSSLHSELIAFIPATTLEEVDLDGIIHEVAVVRNNKSGEYELKKELFDRYNAYFYHYSSEQRSASNNFQSQRRKAAGEPDCFPPPRLPMLKQPFTSIVDLLQCDLMLHIMKTVLERSLNLNSEKQLLQNTLYLMGHALQEEESGHYPFFKFTEKALKWKLESYLDQLQTSTRGDLPIDLIKWTIAKYKEVAGTVSVTHPIESVFEDTEKLRKSKLAAGRKAKILADFAAAQSKFMECNLTVDIEEEEMHETEASYTCIVCRETQTLKSAGGNLNNFVIASFVQYSAVLCADKGNISDKSIEALILDSNRGPAYYTSSCGHVMHANCLRNHLLNFWHQNSVNDHSDPDKLDYFCPLCGRLSNTMLPVMPPFKDTEESNGPLNYDGYKVELSNGLENVIKHFMYFKKMSSSHIDEDIIMAIWKSLTYTLYTVETLLRDSKRPLLGPLSSSRYSSCLESFVRTSGVMMLCLPENNRSSGKYSKTLELILTGRDTVNTFLNLDMLNALIIMTSSMTNFIEITGLHNLHFIFLAELVKILICGKFDFNIAKETTTGNRYLPSEENLTFQYILYLLEKQTDLTEEDIWNYVQEASLPFLRCCVLYYSSMTDKPIPSELTQLEGYTFSNLCLFLGLPQTREELLCNIPTQASSIVKSWCISAVSNNVLHTSKYTTNPYHINQLIELPNDYDKVIIRFITRKLHKPYVCLVCNFETCGEDCCLTIRDGTTIRTYEEHAQKCGVGLFLNVNDCKILCGSIIKNVTYEIEAPYIDHYNETDPGITRGNPLRLSPEKYKILNTFWLSNGIEDELSRKQQELSIEQ